MDCGPIDKAISEFRCYALFQNVKANSCDTIFVLKSSDGDVLLSELLDFAHRLEFLKIILENLILGACIDVVN
jgi:hypothetical protein